jgi:hypothetical protein
VIKSDRQKELVDKILEVIANLNEIDKMIESQPTSLQKVDLELSDLLHLIESGKVPSSASDRVIKKLEELRLERRALKNEHEIELTYLTHKSKLTGKDTRQFLANEIHKTEHRLNCAYKYRILSEEEISELIKEKKKPGRPKKIEKVEVAVNE